MNDKLCLEHGLSIVENPKPSREHYGTWLGNTKQPSFQEQLRRAIDAALEERPKDFEDFLKKLEAAGIEVNRERKNLRLRGPGQKNYTRCNTLKGDYTEQAIQERIEGTRTAKPRRTFSQALPLCLCSNRKIRRYPHRNPKAQPRFFCRCFRSL